MGVNGKGGAGGKVARPVDAAQALVEAVGGVGVHAGEHQQHAGRKAAPQARAVRVRELAAKANLTAQGPDLRNLERRQLLGQ